MPDLFQVEQVPAGEIKEGDRVWVDGDRRSVFVVSNQWGSAPAAVVGKRSRFLDSVVLRQASPVVTEEMVALDPEDCDLILSGLEAMRRAGALVQRQPNARFEALVERLNAGRLPAEHWRRRVMAGELSEAEREAFEECLRPFVAGLPRWGAVSRTEPSERATFRAGWLAARDYYKAEQQAERERLEGLVQKPPLEKKR
jgi:hypothetical protein